MSEPPFDLPKAHRWFAIELNNRAWDLVEAAERSPGETDEMIDAAHGASIHWRAVGTSVNLLRAECLLATAYSLAGLSESSVHHAEKCLRLSSQVGDEQNTFDRASVHGCAANSYACAGDLDAARQHYGKLLECAAELTDISEGQLLSRLYPAPSE